MKNISLKKNDILKTEEKLIDHEKDEIKDKVNFSRSKDILSSILELKNDAKIKIQLDKLMNFWEKKPENEIIYDM